MKATYYMTSSNRHLDGTIVIITGKNADEIMQKKSEIEKNRKHIIQLHKGKP